MRVLEWRRNPAKPKNTHERKEDYIQNWHEPKFGLALPNYEALSTSTTMPPNVEGVYISYSVKPDFYVVVTEQAVWSDQCSTVPGCRLPKYIDLSCYLQSKISADNYNKSSWQCCPKQRFSVHVDKMVSHASTDKAWVILFEFATWWITVWLFWDKPKLNLFGMNSALFIVVFVVILGPILFQVLDWIFIWIMFLHATEHKKSCFIPPKGFNFFQEVPW